MRQCNYVAVFTRRISSSYCSVAPMPGSWNPWCKLLARLRRSTRFAGRWSSVLEHPLSEEDSAFIKSYMDNDSLTRDSAVHVLVDELVGREIERSIHLVRVFRDKLGGEAFGTSDEDNLDCLVSFYCKHVAEKNVASLVHVQAHYRTSRPCV
ncbi:hypothetical protein OS493_008405 [Desmophyllum pertusum]|uniref:Uncharacterized protein n=1 Tax=Desmophyllum pertusum TaxID=174260 RepID=A0A9X0A471_9CNID|nr:hypothetical protein OS493_008405 [Desmophyllum pertusum]